MATSVSISGTFASSDSKAATASVVEQDFLEALCDLVKRFSPSISGLSATLTADHATATINAQGLATWTKRHA